MSVATVHCHELPAGLTDWLCMMWWLVIHLHQKELCIIFVFLCGTRCVDARSLWTVRHSSGCPGLQGQRFLFHKVRHLVSLFSDIDTHESALTLLVWSYDL